MAGRAFFHPDNWQGDAYGRQLMAREVIEAGTSATADWQLPYPGSKIGHRILGKAAKKRIWSVCSREHLLLKKKALFAQE